MEQKLIAIVGSVDESRGNYDPPVKNSLEAKKTAELLGTALAKKGYRIIVYSAAPGFIECDVVRGYVRAKVVRPKSIIVEFPGDQEGASAFPEFKTHKNLFEPVRDTTEAWEPSFFRSVCQADGIALIGGGRSTLITGIFALTNRIPLIAVRAYGGKAEEVWKIFKNTSKEDMKDVIEKMGREGSEETVKDWVDSLEAQASARRREIAEKDQRRPQLIALALIVVCALILALGAYIQPQSKPLDVSPAFLGLLFLGPLVSGASGATILPLLRREEITLRTTILGVAAGLISALLYVFGQFPNYPSSINFLVLGFDIVFGFVGGFTADRVLKGLQGVDVMPAGGLKGAQPKPAK